jgi:hypothetical protein
MALKKQFEVSPGLVAADAYIEVTNVSVVKNEPSGMTVNVFASAENTEKPIQVRCYSFEYRLDGNNAIAQAYMHLKTLPEFAGAIDC